MFSYCLLYQKYPRIVPYSWDIYFSQINMEHIYTMITQQTILKIIMIGLIMFAIFNQIKIVKLIHEKEDLLNADPLTFAAQKYSIGECTCFLSSTDYIWFNQSMSKKVHTPAKVANDYQRINLTGAFIK